MLEVLQLHPPPRRLALSIILVAGLVAVVCLLLIGLATADSSDSAEKPAKPTGLWVAVQSDSLELGIGMRWDHVPGADSYRVRWRSVDRVEGLNEGQRIDSNVTFIFVDEPGDYVVRVQACNGVGCGQPTAKRFTMGALPESTPTPTPRPTPTPANSPPQERPAWWYLQDERRGIPMITVIWERVEGASSYKLRWRRPSGEFEPENEIII